VRWLVVVMGVAVTTFSFVRLIEVNNRATQASPWWWLGLTGSALTVLALGAPWSARTGADDSSRRAGS
jgi:hypothetical protein